MVKFPAMFAKYLPAYSFQLEGLNTLIVQFTVDVDLIHSNMKSCSAIPDNIDGHRENQL